MDAWIMSHQSLLTDRRTGRLARLLGVSKVTAIGHLHVLWWWCLVNAPDGQVSDLDPLDLADGGGWEGPPEVFVSALVGAGWITVEDAGERVTEWEQIGLPLVEKRQAAAARQRAFRQRQRSHPDVTSPVTSPVTPEGTRDMLRHSDVTVTSPSRHELEKRREEKNREEGEVGDLTTARPREAPAAAPPPPPPPISLVIGDDADPALPLIQAALTLYQRQLDRAPPRGLLDRIAADIRAALGAGLPLTGAGLAYAVSQATTATGPKWPYVLSVWKEKPDGPLDPRRPGSTGPAPGGAAAEPPTARQQRANVDLARALGAALPDARGSPG